MSRLIFSELEFGRYDFGMQSIEINNDHNKKNVHEIANIINSRSLSSFSKEELEIYKTYKHERTHQLDCTATLWGMEYTCRMYNWYNNPSSKYLEVISLNDAEVQMHTKFVSANSEACIFKEVKFSLEYDDMCGVFIKGYYLNNYDEIVHTIAVTMLSLLEGHAYAQEQLIACELYEERNDLVSIRLLENEVKKIINDFKSTEYSCFLAMINCYFPNLKLIQQLRLMILVCRFSLNAPNMFLSIFPEEYIKICFPSAKDEYISSLSMELKRGMHRGTYALILLICLAKYSSKTQEISNSTSFEDMENTLLKIYLKEGEGLSDVRDVLRMQWSIEFEVLHNALYEKNATLAFMISKQFIDKYWYFDDLDTLFLPDFHTSDGEKVESSNRLDFDMNCHIDSMIQKVVDLEKAIEQYGMTRRHLAPQVYHDWLLRIKSGETGVRFYPSNF
ncbi:TPA: hypothetical protein ACS705_000577 [Providencia alcalifaciens]